MSCAKNLRVIHINHPLKEQEGMEPTIIGTDVMSIVDQCSPTLIQLGCNTRVWQVSFQSSGHFRVSRLLVDYR